MNRPAKSRKKNIWIQPTYSAQKRGVRINIQIHSLTVEYQPASGKVPQDWLLVEEHDL